MRVGAGLGHLGKFNENAVIHALRGWGPCSQADIAHTTGLSVQTVSTIVNNLKTRGYVEHVRTEATGRGRPRVILDLVPSARHAIGIHIDPTVMSAVILNLKGEVVRVATSEDVDPMDPEGSCRAAGEMVARLVEDVPISSIIGSCLALPGPIDDRDHSMRQTLWLPGWAGCQPGHLLGKTLGYDVPVVKDTLAAVIGESWVRGGDAFGSTMVFVYLGSGTGVGLSVNGEPIRGASGNAGEVGRMLLALGSLYGTSATGLDNDPVQMVKTARQAGIFAHEECDQSRLTTVERQFRQLTELARDGHPEAERIMSAAGKRLAEMVVMTAELIDADLIVLGGPYSEMSQPWYADAILRLLAEPSARGPHPVKVVPSAMGGDVGAVGAAATVLDARYVPRAPGSHKHL